MTGRSLLAAAIVLLVAFPVAAHDIPDARVDRSLQVVLTPPRLAVDYQVSLSFWTLYQDLKTLDAERPDLDRTELLDWYGVTVGPLNARGLLATVDGRPIDWRLAGVEATVEVHPRLTFHLEADVPPRGRLTIEDTNYRSSEGTSRLAFDAAPSVRSTGYEGSARLADVDEVPAFLLTDEEERATRRLDIAYETETPAAPVVATSTVETPRVRTPAPDRPVPPASLGSLLLAPGGAMPPLLAMIAVLLGAGHALQPGHGKSVIVASTVTGQGQFRRSMLMAVAIAGAHLTVAVALALVVAQVDVARFGDINAGLLRITGLVLAVVGAYRLGRSIGGPAGPASAAEPRIGSDREALMVGAAVGLIPCWDAVLLLALAWSIGRAALGIALVIAFSVGSAVTILMVGLAAGLLRRAAARVFASDRVGRALGGLGGSLLAVIGAVLLFR